MNGVTMNQILPGLDPQLAQLLLPALGLFVLLLAARRVPALRALLSFLTWAAFAALVVTLVVRRDSVDPYVERLAAMLRLDRQEVVGTEVRIRLAPDGHFWAKARIGGIERRMLVDSGATLTALSVGTAAAAGLEVRDAPFPILLRTANGTVTAQTATVPDLRLGTIAARGLPVVVSPAFGDNDVLGMNFLSKLKSWRVEDGTLVLEPHHPQDPV